MSEERELCGGTLLTAVDDGVLTLTLNRPDVHNALTLEQVPALVGVLEEASASLGTRAVVIRGAGQHFCTGADLRSVGTLAQHDRPAGAPGMTVGEAARMIRTGWQRLVSAVLDCEKPVIAAVRGDAAGGGLPLALACDLVVAAESARFNCVFAARGLVPDAGTAYLLPRLIGPQRTKELAFFAEPVPAREALGMGLVNRVVADADLDGEVHAWAGRLAHGPTKALAFAKHLVNRSLESDRATSFLEESFMAELIFGSEDSRAAMAAFVGRKGSPEFRGW